jgi:hypothetical protein
MESNKPNGLKTFAISNISEKREKQTQTTYQSCYQLLTTILPLFLENFGWNAHPSRLQIHGEAGGAGGAALPAGGAVVTLSRLRNGDQQAAAEPAGVQKRSKAPVRSWAMASASRPSMSQRSSMKTSLPSRSKAMAGDDGG